MKGAEFPPNNTTAEQGATGNPFAQLWPIAERGRVSNGQFTIGFERTIGEDNEPVEIYGRVYRGSDEEFEWSFIITQDGLEQYDFANDASRKDAPTFLHEDEPTQAEWSSWTDEQRKLNNLAAAVKLIAFVKQVTSAETAPPNP